LPSDDRGKFSNQIAWEEIAPTHISTIPLDFSHYLAYLPPTAHLLEIGCGYGRVLNYIYKSGFVNLVGIDSSLTMINRSYKNGHKAVCVATADALPFSPDIFDCVICIGTLSSIQNRNNIRKALEEIGRVLKKGGVCLVRDFVITFKGKRSFRYLIHAAFLGRIGNFRSPEGIIFHHFTHKEIKYLLSASGFNIEILKEETFETMHKNRCGGVTLVARKL
jgi:ubiquinone/menaquinone biosynthesis C-methylase UbiE